MSNDIRTEILSVLNEVGEDGMTLPAISTALGIPKSTIQPVLTELASRMTIRNTQGLRNVRYWVPSEERLRAEAELSKVRIDRPLKVDRTRLELYERLNKERSAIPSIG